MAKFLFELWLQGKNKTEKDIVDEGVHDENALLQFVNERNLTMPREMQYFEEAWKKLKVAEAPLKKPVKKDEPAPEVKKEPAKTTRTRRAPRKKSHVKETEKTK